MIGQTIGHYRILGKLGAGGMGEVYRAEDITLKRHVALKILPSDVAGSQEKLERFQREAETLASLDHPNIVTLYSVEKAEILQEGGHDPDEAGGHVTSTCPPSPLIHFLTMQLVEGKPLADLIPEAGMSIDQVIGIGISLTEALRAAHEKGIIHRDLKPANVMIDQEGRVKVLDFGLAKLKRAEIDEEASLMATEAMTQEGVVLGTIPYMSPEQIQSETVDTRTDIFSLGIMLHEMLCGQRPFQASNSAALMSSILRDPPIQASEIKRDIPDQLNRALQRCLEKDPLLRYQSADQLWLELKDLQNIRGGSGSAQIEAAVERVLAKVPSEQISAAISESRDVSDPDPGSRSHPGRGRQWLPGLAMVVALIATGLIAAGYSLFFAQKSDAPPSTPVPAQLNHKQLTSQAGTEQYPSLSPDGQWVVYSAESNEKYDVYLQSVSGQTPFNLTEDSPEDNRHPVFSPDGEHIAFRSSREGGGIFVMGRTGEAVRRVTSSGFNPAWSPDGTKLVYSTESVDLNPLNWAGRTELWWVDVATGQQQQLAVENAVQPIWSPGGDRIAYVARMGDATRMDIVSLPVDGGKPVAITDDEFTEWSPVWSQGGTHVYFASDRSGSMNLWRIAVDEESGHPTGEPEPLTTPATYLAHPSLSADGTRIAYSSVLMTQNIQQIEMDPTSVISSEQSNWITSGSSLWSSVDCSPDGEWLVFYTRTRPEGDLYVARTDGTGLRQLTSDGAIDRVPRWSPDGEWVAFFSDRSGSLQLWRIRRDGSGLQQLTEHPDNAGLAAWSPDGSQIAVLSGLEASSETVLFDPDRPWSEQTPHTLPPIPDADQFFVVTSWSSDGGMLAGQIGYPGTGVMIYSFETESYQQLTDFGEWPVWLPDSRRLMFVSGGKDFFVVDLKTQEPQKVFSVPRDVIGPPRISGDGRQVFFTRRVTEADVWLLTLGDGK